MPTDPRKLAKAGKYEELAAAWQAGDRFDLKPIFERAVTDFRTVKRRPGHFKILKFCVEKGLEVDREIIQWTARAGNRLFVEYLCERGFSLACEDPFVAAYLGDLGSLKRYGEDGALADLRDGSGLNLLHAAAASGLGRHEPAFRCDLSTTCAYLIEQEVSVSASVPIDVAVSPAYCCAAFGGNADIMRQLLETGDVDIANLHLEVEFALEPHQRSGEPFYDVAQVILDHGFDLNSIRPSQGRTLLHACANHGTKKAVKWLLEKGADPNSLDEGENTPLHAAAERNTFTSVVEMLIDSGADLKALNGQGQTALDVAENKGRQRVAEYLRSFSSRCDLS